MRVKKGFSYNVSQVFSIRQLEINCILKLNPSHKNKYYICTEI